MFAVPDLINLDKTAEGIPILRVGAKSVMYTPVEHSTGINMVLVRRDDLVGLSQEAFRIGYNTKATEQLKALESLQAEIVDAKNKATA